MIEGKEEGWVLQGTYPSVKTNPYMKYMLAGIQEGLKKLDDNIRSTKKIS